MILWDTKKRGGRPDTMKLLKDTWHSFGAEVIFITSNKQGNDEMMQGCQEGEFPFRQRGVQSKSTGMLTLWIRQRAFMLSGHCGTFNLDVFAAQGQFLTQCMHEVFWLARWLVALDAMWVGTLRS